MLGEPADQDMVLGGDLDEVGARPLAPRSPLDAWDLACVLDAVAETADQDVALALADRAETLIDIGDGHGHDILLRSVTLLLARRGQVERAMALADRLDADLRVGRQAEIVGEPACYGDMGRAEALAHAITDCRAQARALIEVVRELARRGDPDRAEVLVHSITDRWAQGEALVAVVRELARHGDPGRAPHPLYRLPRDTSPRAGRTRRAVRAVPRVQACCTGRGSRRLGRCPAGPGADRAPFSGSCRRSDGELIRGKVRELPSGTPPRLPGHGISTHAPVASPEHQAAGQHTPRLSPLIARLTP
ncbi:MULTISPECIES: hypothetical protein [unclassified Streptomyces]|uniref:hypothetical protein n=1 Tax=unclassified Streptomyces TaxID=2593676 RepID=UPI00380E7CA7